MQEIVVIIKGGYSPNIIRVKKGIPLRLIFDRQEAGDCSSRVVFPDFQASKTLAPFTKTTIEFTPDKAGQFGFTCGMNMLHGTLIVKEGEKEGETADTSESTYAGPAPEHVHEHQHEYAEAVGVGPTMPVSITEQVEFALIGGGVPCPTCVINIETALGSLPSIDDVKVNFGAERITARYDPEEMQKLIESTGYKVQIRSQQGTLDVEDKEAAERSAERKGITRRLIFSAILTTPVVFTMMTYEFFNPVWLPEFLLNRWLQLALITPVMLYAGWPIHRTGWLTLRHRTADMNTLITVGTISAFAYSLVVTIAPSVLPENMRAVYYEAVGVIITLILLGRLLAAIAKGGTGEAIRKLIGLQAKTARVVRNGKEEDIPIERVQLGDIVVVRPGEKVSADGEIGIPCWPR